MSVERPAAGRRDAVLCRALLGLGLATALACLGASNAGVARAAPEALCREYAQSALRQYDEAVARGVPNVGPPMWSNDYNGHLAWCLIADEKSVFAETQKRDQVLAPYRTPQGPATQPPPSGGATGTIAGPLLKADDTCARYAKQAVLHQEINQQKGCGFQGPSWDARQDFHEAWCRRQSDPDVVMAAHKARVDLLARCQQPKAQMQQGTREVVAGPGDLLRVPGLVIGLRHVRCKNRPYVSDYGNNEHGAHALKDPTVLHHPVLTYTCGGDEGAPEHVGFAWNSFPESVGPPAETLGLPAGVVFDLFHNRTQGGGGIGRYSDGPGYIAAAGGDLGSGDFGRHSLSWYGYVWKETDGSGFAGDWSIVDRLPRYTVIGLKHSENQQAKRLYWLAPDRTHMMTYDAACPTCPEPPDFARVHGGDRGAPEHAGYYWFEKTTGVEPSEIR